MSKSWKAVERAVARFFGGRRAPLSGSNSGHTGGDVIHPAFFIEVKHHKRFAVWSLYEKTKIKAKEERKIPILALKEKGRRGFLIVVHSDDWDEVIGQWRVANESN